MSTIQTFSTLQKSLGMRQTVAQLSRDQQKAQTEVVTGLQSDVFGATGFRATQSLDMRNRMARIEGFSVANNLLSGKLEVISGLMSSMRGEVQEFLATASAITGTNGGGAVGDTALMTQAGSLIQSLSQQLNAPYAGEYLFSGMDIGAAAVSGSAAMPAPGLAGGAAAAIGQLDAWYGLNGAPASAGGYSDSVYSGSRAGLRNVQLDEVNSLSYGITADNEAFRHVFKGLTMLSAGYLDQIPEADQKTWVSEAISALSQGIGKLQYEEAVLGNQQGLIAGVIGRQSSLATLYNNRIVDIEGVDAYEAATRLEALNTRLEASYQVTVRMQNLSLLNFL